MQCLTGRLDMDLRHTSHSTENALTALAFAWLLTQKRMMSLVRFQKGISNSTQDSLKPEILEKSKSSENDLVSTGGCSCLWPFFVNLDEGLVNNFGEEQLFLIWKEEMRSLAPDTETHLTSWVSEFESAEKPRYWLKKKKRQRQYNARFYIRHERTKDGMVSNLPSFYNHLLICPNLCSSNFPLYISLFSYCLILTLLRGRVAETLFFNSDLKWFHKAQ